MIFEQRTAYTTLITICLFANVGCYPKPPIQDLSKVVMKLDQAETPAIETISPEEYIKAAYEGDLAQVQRAVRQGTPIDSLDAEGRTALMLAAFEGHNSVVEALLKAGAVVDFPGPFSRTALMFAATGTNAETVEILLKAGANVNAKDTHENWTPLMFAASEGHLDVVRTILDRNPDIDFREVDGENALDFAAQRNHPDVVKLIQSRMKAPK